MKCQMTFVLFLALLGQSTGHSQVSENRRSLGVEFTASILPKATITQNSEKYIVKSALQSSYELGLNKHYSLTKTLFLSTGIHLIIGKYNYYMDLPETDMVKYGILNGRKFLEDKALWHAIELPLTITKGIKWKEFSHTLVSAGVNLRFSGLMNDFLVIGSITDTARRKIQYFTHRISPDNQKRPWISFMASVGKAYILDNKNQVLINLKLDVSPRTFFKGEYAITMPGEPAALGTYKINGSGIGLSLEYTFTGENKRIIRRYDNEHK